MQFYTLGRGIGINKQEIIKQIPSVGHKHRNSEKEKERQVGIKKGTYKERRTETVDQRETQKYRDRGRQMEICGQSYKHFTIVIYDPRVVIWGVFKSGTALES